MRTLHGRTTNVAMPTAATDALRVPSDNTHLEGLVLELKEDRPFRAFVENVGVKELDRLTALLRSVSEQRKEFSRAARSIEIGATNMKAEAAGGESANQYAAQLISAETLDTMMQESRWKRFDASLMTPQACPLPSCSICVANDGGESKKAAGKFELVDQDEWTQTHLRTRPGKENVLWLEESFGDIPWPQSVHGHTTYKARWRLDELAPDIASESFHRKSPDSLSEPGEFLEAMQAAGSGPGHVTVEASIALGEPVNEDWPFPDDYGYESDGDIRPFDLEWLDSMGADEDLVIDAARMEGADAENTSHQGRGGKGGRTFSHLREAAKSVAVAARTGVSIDTQKRKISENWIIRCFVMTPLELVVTKIQVVALLFRTLQDPYTLVSDSFG